MGRERDESPSCVICENKIGLDVEAFCIRVGRLRRSRKHNEWYFHPRCYQDGEDVRWAHLGCLEEIGLGFEEVGDDHTDCGFCPEDLIGEESCYEIEAGRFEIHGPDTVWCEDIQEFFDGRSRVLRINMCSDCLEMRVREYDGWALTRLLGFEDDFPDPGVEEDEEEKIPSWPTLKRVSLT